MIPSLRKQFDFRLVLVLSVFVLSAGMFAASAADVISGPRSGKWAHEESAIAPNERVTWGRLSNGMRYALLPHAAVPGRVSMRLVVLTGSMDEKDGELGIAHFTEHMCFRGTREFPYHEMNGFFHKLGMEYGSDVNAITTFDHTAYMLEYRDNNPDLLHEGLRLFRNIADGVLFDPAFIEKERGVILSEMRTRDGIASRQSMAAFPVVYQGLNFPQRIPKGTAESIRTVSRKNFLQFYERGYRPDLMILVAAGDFDVAEMTRQLTAILGPIKKPDALIPVREEGKLDTTRSLRAGLFKITDIGSVAATVASVAPLPRGPETREMNLDRLRRGFAMSLLRGRISSAIPDSGGGDASFDTLLGYDTAQAMVMVSGENWQHGLLALDQVVRSTYERGFEQREIDQLRRRLTSLLQHMAEQAPVLDPGVLSENLAESIVTHSVFVGYEEDYRRLQEVLKTLTPKNMLEAYRAAWDLDRMAFNLAGDVHIEGGASEILKVVQKYRKGGLRYLRPNTRRETDFELKKWGKPTEVVEERDVPELGARLFRFGNNVRLNYVFSRSEPGIVYASVRVGTGLLDMPGGQPALKEFGIQTLLASGTTHFTNEKLGEVIEDHLLGFSLDVDDHDAFTFRGTAGTENVDAFLGVVTDFLYKPIFETFALRSEKMKAFLGRSQARIGMGEGMRELTNHLFKGDPRFTWATFSNYMGMSVSDVRSWLREPLTRGYLEATIVGDISEENVINLVSRSLGSLAPRAATKRLDLPPPPPRITAFPGFKRIEFVGEKHLGLVTGTWPVEERLEVGDKASLNVLAKILELRIREEVRDNRGLAYSPAVTFTPYNGFPKFSLMQAMIDCGPSEAHQIARIVEEIAGKIAAEGVGESEFIGSRGILSGQVKSALKENEFLLHLLQRAQERPETIDESIALQAGLIATVTIEDVNRWAKKILSPKNTYTAAIVPKQFIGIFQTGGP
ncbi:MAG TPA: insulinase family protein [Opitutaceae bacterium]